jgi:hypothetical protein
MVSWCSEYFVFLLGSYITSLWFDLFLILILHSTIPSSLYNEVALLMYSILHAESLEPSTRPYFLDPAPPPWKV